MPTNNQISPTRHINGIKAYIDYHEITALKWLRNLITDCQSYLLRKHTQYDSAKWGL